MLTYKWYWQGIPIEELTNIQAGDALHWIQEHPLDRNLWEDTGENIATLRNINYSGRPWPRGDI
jgi:hypothetical protein